MATDIGSPNAPWRKPQPTIVNNYYGGYTVQPLDPPTDLVARFLHAIDAGNTPDAADLEALAEIMRASQRGEGRPPCHECGEPFGHASGCSSPCGGWPNG